MIDMYSLKIHFQKLLNGLASLIYLEDLSIHGDLQVYDCESSHPFWITWKCYNGWFKEWCITTSSTTRAPHSFDIIAYFVFWWRWSSIWMVRKLHVFGNIKALKLQNFEKLRPMKPCQIWSDYIICVYEFIDVCSLDLTMVVLRWWRLAMRVSILKSHL